MAIERVLIVTGSIFVLTRAVLAVQIGASKFATSADEHRSSPTTDVGIERPR